MRYFSTHRPVAPGSYPKPSGNKVVEINNYDSRTFCEELGREVWGYIDYEHPLSPEQARSYELIADAAGCIGCRHDEAVRDIDL